MEFLMEGADDADYPKDEIEDGEHHNVDHSRNEPEYSPVSFIEKYDSHND